jgi:peptide/nickel transport system ATP-binding protein
MLRHGKAKDSASAIAKAASLLESVGLRPGAEIAAKYPHELSGGQRQRVAVARALAVDPALILADEPTSMLDASIRVGVLNLLRDLKERRGIAFLYITHDLASARYLADRTLVLYGGHLVEEGPADELFDRPAHPYTKMLLAAAPGAPGGRGRDASIVVPAAKPSSNGAIAHSGCVFSERCPDVKDQCRRESPAAKPISAARLVRCHFA